MLAKYRETQAVVYRDKSLPSFGILTVIMSLVLFSSGASLFAQTLTIRLVDGRNGRPMVGKASHVNVWVGTKPKETIVIPTSENGVARLQLTLNTSEINIPNSSNGRGSIVVSNPIVKYDESLRINVPYAWCIPKGSNFSWLMFAHFSTKQLLQQGYVSPNTCGKATASPKPGEVVFFVRPLSFWEGLRD